MRIAYVINSVEGGGAASPVPALTRVLRDLGAQVRVFALTRRNGRALPPMEAAGLEPLVREGGEHDHLAALRWLSRETREWGATHLWTSLSRATLLGLMLGPRQGLPVFCWQHNAFLKTGNRILLRALQHRAQAWIADSDCVASLTRTRLKVEDQRLLTWPIFAADPEAPRARAWQRGEPLRLCSLGRLHPAKGYDVLIGALALLRREGFRAPVPFTISIAGEGAMRPRLESMAQAAGLRELQWLGFTDKPRVLLADMHLYLQPSRVEGFCIAAHEAMLAGLPVVASSVGELPHTLLPEVTGLLVPPGNVPALAHALREMLSSPDELDQMGTRARERILERFSLQRFNACGQALFDRMSASGKWRRGWDSNPR